MLELAVLNDVAKELMESQLIKSKSFTYSAMRIDFYEKILVKLTSQAFK
jgi:hypothetical protein